jgi:hypothetical protein
MIFLIQAIRKLIHTGFFEKIVGIRERRICRCKGNWESSGSLRSGGLMLKVEGKIS